MEGVVGVQRGGGPVSNSACQLSRVSSDVKISLSTSRLGRLTVATTLVCSFTHQNLLQVLADVYHLTRASCLVWLSWVGFTVALLSWCLLPSHLEQPRYVDDTVST
jgi:hypothetical protein